MNIEAKNKLIADFMGSGHDAGGVISFYYTVGEDFPYSGDTCALDNIEKEIAQEVEVFGNTLESEVVSFHNSWDWLMPVVEKISGYYHKTEIGSDEESDYCRIIIYDRDNAYVEEIFECGLNTLEATYKAVIQFVLWYNENQKS